MGTVISKKMLFLRGFIIVLILCFFQEQAWGADCKVFKQKCQALCLEQSGGVSSAQCWGTLCIVIAKPVMGQHFILMDSNVKIHLVLLKLKTTLGLKSKDLWIMSNY